MLQKWNKARQAIAECKTIDEAKDIRDKAEALRAYAKQAKESLQVQNDIAEIKLRAERKIGEFSKELDKEQGKRTDITSSHDDTKLTKTAVLEDVGISRQTANRYERIAEMPQEAFEKHITNIKGANEELTTAGILRVSREIQREERNEGLKKTSLKMPDNIYRVFYADPPWKYNDSGVITEADNYGRAQRHYPTLSIEELTLLPIKDISQADAVLF